MAIPKLWQINNLQIVDHAIVLLEDIICELKRTVIVHKQRMVGSPSVKISLCR